MPITDSSMYRRRDDIVAEMAAQLVAAIPDAYTGEDGALMIVFEIEGGQLENVYLANQLVLEDLFIQTASYNALQRYGNQYGVPMGLGLQSSGTLQFTGDGGTYIPIGSEVASDPGQGLDPVFFVTTTDGTIPNPGTPVAPTVAVNVSAGNLNGTYEYVVTFVTASGETLPSPISAAINPVNQQANLTAIPLGGAGTISRRIYRDKNGAGTYRRVTEIANNTATTFTDNVTDATVAGGALVPAVDTAHSISVSGQAEDAGIDGNVAIGTITELTNSPASLSAVINTTAFTGGSEPEDTESYRTRLLNFVRSPGTGSPSDLKSWAENVAGVETATVFPNTPVNGTVTVTISGPGGSVPSGAVVSAVQAALQAQDMANITIVVNTFTAVPTAVTVDVTTSGTYTLTDVTPSVVAAITDYINGLQVAETLKISGIIDAVFGLAGVDDVVVTTPTTNQTTSAGSKRTPGTITVT